jgi:hypothetical protein
MKTICTATKVLALAAALAFAAFSSSPVTPTSHAGGPPTLDLDFDISDGACEDIDTTATVTLGGTFQVAVCLWQSSGTPIAAFQYRIVYDDRLVRVGELPDTSPALDDSPDANAGSTTFTSATYPDPLGSGWTCNDAGAPPAGDLDGIAGNAEGIAFSGGCSSWAGPNTLDTGALGVATFSSVGAGVATLEIEAAVVTSNTLFQIGSCNPTDITAMECTGGTVNVQQGNSTISGKVYVNSVAPANVLAGVQVAAGGLGAVVTDSAGGYAVTGLPAGSYTVTATPPSPFTGAGIGPVVVGAGGTVSGQDIIVTGPAGAITGLVYKDSVSPPNLLAGATVAACATICRTATTNASGAYTIAYLPDDSYTVTVWPPGNYLQASVGPVVVSGGSVAAPVLVAPPAVAPPAGTVTPALGNTVQPTVLGFEDFTLTRTGACAGGIGSYTITQDSLLRSGSMTEGPAGTYTAVVTPLLGADPGQAIVVITIDCPTGPDNVLTFSINIFIDPSGFVRDMQGNPIPGATVTLYKGPGQYGPWLQVANGDSTVMSIANRDNPDLSDANGHFGWIVAPGHYIVRASKPGCLVPEAFNRSAFNRSTFQTEALLVPPERTDLDLRLDCTPSPCMPSDPTIPNSDNLSQANGPFVPGDDITIPRSDANNDSCDTDDDNDGILDVNEDAFPLPACTGASGPISSVAMDTDRDGLTDGWECANNSDPADPASKELGSGTADSDGDHINDLWERRGYNGLGSTTDSDGDGCADLVEVISIDGNKAITDSDRVAIARRVLNIWGPEPFQDYVMDIDKNGTLTDIDRLVAARAALLPTWLPKTCP